MSTQRIRVQDEEFDCSLSGKAWESAERLDVVDGTIELEVVSTLSPTHNLVGLIHGRLVRASADKPFVVSISAEQVGELVEDARANEWDRDEDSEESRRRRIHVPNARWGMAACAVPTTSAPLYAGRARDVLEARFALGSASWMQDWPLEVSDPERVEEFCAFYDETGDPLVRFDVMQLVLFSVDQANRARLFDGQTDVSGASSAWLSRTLRRDFALHGNTVAYWAALDREASDPELRRPDPELVFTISGLLRDVWEASLVPVKIDWHPHEGDVSSH